MGIRYNDYIKRPDEQFEYKPEDVRALLNCSTNINNFLQYIRIVHPDRGRIEFEPYSFQKTILKKMAEHRFICCLCSRQSGKTTTVSVYALWYSIFNSDKTIGIVSNKQTSAIDIMNRIKLMYEELPVWIKPGVKEYSKTFILFDNGTRIMVSATSPDAFRGRTINLLICDEIAFVPKGICEDFWAANYPTISASEDAKIILISTPNGVFNLFHRIYSQAERGENTFKHIRVTWREVPGRDETWAQEQLKNLGKVKFSQEYAVEFLGSTNTVIDPITLEYLFDNVREPLKTEMGNKYSVYEEPEAGAQYVIGCDTAKGTGENASTLQIMKIISLTPLKYKQVAVYNDNQTDVYLFAEIINRLSYYYNNAYIMCENNSEGSAVVNRLWWEFENSNLVNTGSKNADLGVRASKNTKPRAVLLMKKLIEDKCVEIYDKDTVYQLGSFIEVNGSFKGKDLPDDLVSALYWACYFVEMNIIDDYDLMDSKPTNTNSEEEVWGFLSDVSTETDDDFSWLQDWSLN